MRAELLHVVTAMFNPMGWDSRIRLYRDFEEHMLASGVRLTTVECVLGDRPHAPRHSWRQSCRSAGE